MSRTVSAEGAPSLDYGEAVVPFTSVKGEQLSARHRRQRKLPASARRKIRVRRKVGRCTRINSSVIRARQTDGNKVVPLRCKSWHHPACTDCGKLMWGRWLDIASQEVLDHNLTRMLTLTLGPECAGMDVRQQSRFIAEAWAKMRRRIARRPTSVRRDGTQVYRPLTAIWVREYQKNGAPHLHILVDRFLPQRWVSAAWQECGGGPIVDIRRVPESRAVAYLGKYLAKALTEPVPGANSLKGLRRYGAVGDASLSGVYPSGEPGAYTVEAKFRVGDLDRFRGVPYLAAIQSDGHIWVPLMPNEVGPAIAAAMADGSTVGDAARARWDATVGQRDRFRRARDASPVALAGSGAGAWAA